MSNAVPGMARFVHPDGPRSIGIDGVNYEPDKDGVVSVPAEFAYVPPAFRFLPADEVRPRADTDGSIPNRTEDALLAAQNAVAKAEFAREEAERDLVASKSDLGLAHEALDAKDQRIADLTARFEATQKSRDDLQAHLAERDKRIAEAEAKLEAAVTPTPATKAVSIPTIIDPLVGVRMTRAAEPAPAAKPVPAVKPKA